MKGPERVDRIIHDIDEVLGGYAEIASPDIIAELAWDGLKKAVEEGWLSQMESELMYYQHFARNPGDFGT